jgi:serine/threonine protein kinase
MTGVPTSIPGTSPTTRSRVDSKSTRTPEYNPDLNLMPQSPGSRLDAYNIVRPLGSGGMGEVWLATEVRLSRKVALKVLPADLTRDPLRVDRFEQEARAASALNHPNVCTIGGMRMLGIEL